MLHYFPRAYGLAEQSFPRGLGLAGSLVHLRPVGRLAQAAWSGRASARWLVLLQVFSHPPAPPSRFQERIEARGLMRTRLRTGTHHFSMWPKAVTRPAQVPERGNKISSWWEEQKSHFVKGLDVRRGRELEPFLQPTYHSYSLRYFPLKK